MGTSVGAADGTNVGFLDGAAVVGSAMGAKLGASLGPGVLAALRLVVGDATCVGAPDGAWVTSRDGCSVGVVVRICVGAGVGGVTGLEVGNAVHTLHVAGQMS